LDLLQADYSYLNERLARHYGVENVYGTQFRQVKLADINQRGLLTICSLHRRRRRRRISRRWRQPRRRPEKP
jgi:hypothetical protein